MVTSSAAKINKTFAKKRIQAVDTDQTYKGSPLSYQGSKRLPQSQDAKKYSLGRC